MRIESTITVPRVDLATLRKLVPPLRSEWADLRFATDGWLLDPDTEQPLRALRLAAGRHRMSGARYLLAARSAHLDLASDDGRTIRGTVSSDRWSADVELGDRLTAAGRADVAAVLRDNDVPGIAIPLIGGRQASGNAAVDLAALERGGELVRGHATAQRAGGELDVRVKAGHGEWHGRVMLHVGGRGLLGRLAFLLLRSKIRSSLRKDLDETLADLTKDADRLAADLRRLDEEIRDTGGADAFVHRYLWQALRGMAAEHEPDDLPRVTEPAHTGVASPDTAAHLHRGALGVRRWRRRAEFGLPADASKYLVDHGRLTDTTQLIVRPAPGRLKAHWPAQGRYDNPPVFHGTVSQDGSGLTIDGTISETRSARGWALGWGFVTVWMALLAGFGIYGIIAAGSQALAPLLIGAIATPPFALFWRSARKSRRPDFDKGAVRLEQGLRRWFTSGDGTVHYLW